MRTAVDRQILMKLKCRRVNPRPSIMTNAVRIKQEIIEPHKNRIKIVNEYREGILALCLLYGMWLSKAACVRQAIIPKK